MSYPQQSGASSAGSPSNTPFDANTSMQSWAGNQKPGQPQMAYGARPPNANGMPMQGVQQSGSPYPTNLHQGPSNGGPFSNSQQNGGNSTPGPPMAPPDRRRAFYGTLAQIMLARGAPLPPQLTGVPNDKYDPNTSRWKALELGEEVGTFRLSGKSVELFALFGLVQSAGGGQAVTSSNSWNMILQRLDVPTEWPSDRPQMNNRTVAQDLQSIYQALLSQIEAMAQQSKNASQAQASAEAQRRLSQPPSNSPITPVQQPQSWNNQNSGQWNSASSSQSPLPPDTSLNGPRPPLPSSSSSQAPPIPSDSNSVLPGDSLLKRKAEPEEADAKRIRLKSESPAVQNGAEGGPSSGPSASVDSKTTMPPGLQTAMIRKKIEYVPLAREIDTSGGRNLKGIEAEWHRGRQLRDVNSWGMVHTDYLTMSIRSRMATEMAYALTTLTMVSTMRGSEPGSGFPIHQAPDLMDEVLDLLEDTAFENTPDRVWTRDAAPTVTQRRILDYIQDNEMDVFADTTYKRGDKDPALGPLLRPGALILVCTNILRNLSLPMHNAAFLNTKARMFDLMLRLCDITQKKDGTLEATSPALTLSDLLVVRRDTLHLLYHLSPYISFKLMQLPSNAISLLCARFFDLAASFILDEHEALSPAQVAQQSGPTDMRPPYLADVALEILTKIGCPDSNRDILGQSVTGVSIWPLFGALIKRLPVIDSDFAFLRREEWLSYVEKVVLAIYTLAFIASPAMKRKMKLDPKLRFPTVMLRLITRCLATPPASGFNLSFCAKRAVEAVKVIDEEDDKFAVNDDSVGTPTLAFGMGYGEWSEAVVERGMGVLTGKSKINAFEHLLPQSHNDMALFGEIDSLLRLDV